ncbi:putative 5'(3')-deoxyribonucleotidase [Siminovitchia terrae]|uniref:5' nucleotidase, NT5C type n=1 Tax=Siminovitchia terrae TaxID=1914933 RepID=UPI001B1DCB9A|nr:5'-3'-deoxyribonucleotidase [Siminovitchia terrae]GIN93766.1 putative 5'(3')-deoxyribonucleotidase [Siminovitchia terrae]
MKRIAIDMDEVMADTIHKSLLVFNERFDKHVTRENLTGTKLDHLFPHLKEEIYQMYNHPDFFRDLPVIENCRETILELSEHYEIMIATAAMEVPESFRAKYEWLKENFDFLNDNYFVFCGDKSVIEADYLIDDNIYQLDSFKHQGILYTAAHNINEEYDVRCNNWLEIKKYLMDSLSHV